MKKTVIGILTVGISLFADIDLTKSANVDKIGLAGLSNSTSKIDKVAGGRWYLKQAKRDKYREVRNDEFALDDAISTAYNEMIANIKSNQNIIGQSSSFVLNSKFEKYNFKDGYFPIKGALTKKTGAKFYGKRIIGNGGYHLQGIMDNTDSIHNKLSLKKEMAKKFLASRKNSRGFVNKKIDLKYYFTIQKIEPTYSVKRINSCNKYFEDCDILKGKIIGHVTKLEILDTSNNNKVLQTYNY